MVGLHRKDMKEDGVGRAVPSLGMSKFTSPRNEKQSARGEKTPARDS